MSTRDDPIGGPARCGRAGGFTLMEVLVALTILSIALTALFAIFGQSLTRSSETQSRMAARALAAGLIARAETSGTLGFGETSGTTPSGLAWRLRVRPYGNEADRQAWPSDAATITAAVAWGGKGAGQTLSLSTLHLLPKASLP